MGANRKKGGFKKLTRGPPRTAVFDTKYLEARARANQMDYIRAQANRTDYLSPRAHHDAPSSTEQPLKRKHLEVPGERRSSHHPVSENSSASASPLTCTTTGVEEDGTSVKEDRAQSSLQMRYGQSNRLRYRCETAVLPVPIVPSVSTNEAAQTTYAYHSAPPAAPVSRTPEAPVSPLTPINSPQRPSAHVESPVPTTKRKLDTLGNSEDSNKPRKVARKLNYKAQGVRDWKGYVQLGEEEEKEREAFIAQRDVPKDSTNIGGRSFRARKRLELPATK